MEYYGIHYDSIIEHHGILGMKWGVRRYQNADGTLTAKGKKRYAKVASSPRLAKAETRGAKSIAKRNVKDNTRYAKAYETAAKKYRSKAEKATDAEKISKYREKAKRNFRIANEFNRRAKYSNRVLKDIESGKKKAGRDFITQTDYDFMPLGFLLHGGVYVGGGLSVTTSLIERNSKNSLTY